MESLGLDLSKVPMDLILNILNIVLFFLIVRALAYKPIRKFMDARTEKVNAAAKAAEEKAAEADAAKAQYDALLADSETKSRAILQESKKQADADAAQILENAKAQAEQILRDADADAAKKRADALQGMQEQVVDLAFGISEKLLAHSIRDDDTKKLADRLFDSRTGGGDQQ